MVVGVAAVLLGVCGLYDSSIGISRRIGGGGYNDIHIRSMER